MKRITKSLLILLSGGFALAACNSNNTNPPESQTPKDTATIVVSQPMDYPYKIDKPDNWDMGSQQNTMNALQALKAWETKNYDESVKYFGDSIRLRFDAYDKKVPNDTLKAFFTSDGNNIKSVSIKLEDWESVISKDKKDEYVTIWYRQFTENNAGKKDSVDVVNDLKMKDGKIIGIDEYRRKLH